MTYIYNSKQPMTDRDLSWILFNNRVMAEAMDTNLPLLERALSLSFVSSNEDEFFMVRVAALYNSRKLAKGTEKRLIRNLISEIRRNIVDMDNNMDAIAEGIRNELKTKGIHIYSKMPNDESVIKWSKEVFKTRIAPLLTPIAILPTRPFPLAKGKSLHIAVMLDDQPGSWATVKLPDKLPRLLLVPSEDGKTRMMLIDTIIAEHISTIFGRRKIRYITPYRILRDAEAEFTDTETGDFLSSVRGVLKTRKRGDVMRLEVAKNAPQELVALLAESFKIKNKEIYYLSSPLDTASYMRALYKIPGFDELRYPKYEPYMTQAMAENDLFEEISKGDILLFHPYESFDPVVRLLQDAAKDPHVLAVKQTLYRVSGDSPIIAALIEAAKLGKQVTVFIELKARFDEENNIIWGEMMEKAGCQVIYGLPGLKTHSKITLIVRNENDVTKHYLHLGTGNYHDGTAKSYTDLSLLTVNEKLGNDAVQFFHILTGYGQTTGMNSLITAPNTLRDKLMDLIKRETENAKVGIPARIDGKMNALVDGKIIKALYKASQAGVKIKLMVRSACCLMPGIPGLSENIEVRSIVGRHLEHARIYRFANGGEPEMFLSSADWMPRNLDKRVELMFPIKDPDIRQRIDEIMEIQHLDTVKAWELKPNGQYIRVRNLNPTHTLNAQEVFMETHGWTENKFDLSQFYKDDIEKDK
ncbi:MAG: polyphosphate kinase 1 [Christensenellaceae bacterium]|nr:polyphosphate kinase 1 [Christensenellaceae bacterium]